MLADSRRRLRQISGSVPAGLRTPPGDVLGALGFDSSDLLPDELQSHGLSLEFGRSAGGT
jgi:hypothetical protein